MMTHLRHSTLDVISKAGADGLAMGSSNASGGGTF
jgi:hypothetical protein